MGQQKYRQYIQGLLFIDTYIFMYEEYHFSFSSLKKSENL